MNSSQHLVIITGHSSGLGQALLQHCLQDKTYVVGIARRRLELQHPNLKQIQADLSSHEHSIDQWLKPLETFLAATSWQTVTLVNNAGTVQPIGFVGDLDGVQIAASLHTNLTVPLQLSNWLVRQFPKVSLRIAQISSGAAHKPYAGWSVYCSSKAGLRMAGQVMVAEAEISGRDLRVLVYEPGILNTPMQAELRSTPVEQFPQRDRFRQLHSSGELVNPDESAKELWALLCRQDLPRFLETRYGAGR